MYIEFEQIKDIVDKSLLGDGKSTVFNNQKNEEYYKKNGYREYHIQFIKKIDSLFNFEGSTVLEIGGSNMPYELLIDRLKVKKWVSLDTPWWSMDNSPHVGHKVPIIPIKEVDMTFFSNSELKYVIVRGITDDINEIFYNQFDIIVSNCCFEHIKNLPLAFSNMYSCLREGGVGYSSFSPIWSAYHGHHVWLSDDIGIKLGDLKCFPRHGHLLLSKLDIYKLLKLNFPNSKNLDADSELLKYGDYGVNHHFYEDYEYFMKESPFEKYIIQPAYETEEPEQTLKLLREMYYPYEKFNYGGVSMIFSK